MPGQVAARILHAWFDSRPGIPPGATPIEEIYIMAHAQYATCIEACNACADACDHCAAACLKEPDPKPMARCIALDMDCAAICRMAASYMARDSEFAMALCADCAEVCEACGAECAKHKMAHCQECAEACRRCAEECRRMSGAKTSRTTASVGRPAH
jgi:hypothetical protein